jgi:hypothetical protein
MEGQDRSRLLTVAAPAPAGKLISFLMTGSIDIDRWNANGIGEARLMADLRKTV